MYRILTAIFIFLSIALHGQIVDNKYPWGWNEKNDNSIPVISFPEVDHQELYLEDNSASANKEVPYRIAVAFDSDIDIKNVGKVKNDKYGSKHWLVQLNLPQAYGIGLIFSEFLIPDGAELFIYNKDKSALLGAVTSVNNNPNQVLSVVPVEGSEIIVHYSEPVDAEFSGKLVIETVTHVYKDIFKREKGFGDSGNCNVNVVCPEGESWEKQVRSIGMIVTNSGTRWCTGTLINNANNDNTPYFLTANHCILDAGDDPSTWSFIFNYKSSECSPSENGLLGNSVFGAEVKASNNTNDFALLQLNQSPPEEYNIYYAGWSRNIAEISNTTGIHHPSGDVMKISKDFDAPELSAYLGGVGDDYWRVIDWDEGTTEGGSSGSALFNPEGQIIGQLRGGMASCNNELSDYYGAFYKSWDGQSSDKRLKDWLDPEDQNPDTLNGNDPLIDQLLDLNQNDLAFIYPNPAEGKVYIKFKNQLHVNEISILDVQGRLMRTISVNNEVSGILELQLDQINPGFYQLFVHSDVTNLIFKLIVK